MLMALGSIGASGMSALAAPAAASSLGAAVTTAAAPAVTAAATTTPGTVNPVAPFRALDTRNKTGTTTTTPVPGGSTVKVAVTGRNGVPAASGVAAVAITLTVTQTSGPGYVTAYPSGTARPNASNINYLANQTLANAAFVPVGSDGTITLFTSGTTHLLVDVTAYSVAGTAATPGALTSVSPYRAVDTRLTGNRLSSPSTPLTVPVTGAGNVPAASQVAAVVLNLTVTNGTAANYVSVRSTRAATLGVVPLTSSVNYNKGQTVANLVVVPVGADGTIQVVLGNGGGQVDVIADVQGWVKIGALNAAGTMRATTGTRVLDTRSGRPVAALGTVVVHPQLGSAQDTRNLSAVVLNVTVTSTTAAGYATTYASGTTRPLASNLNWLGRQTIAAQVVAPVGADGTVTIYNGSSGTTHVVVDQVATVMRTDATTASGWSNTADIPVPTGLTGDLIPHDVACAADGTCSLSGTVVDASGHPTGFLGRWDGSSWVTRAVQGEGAASQQTACASATLCAAAGHALFVSTSASSGWVQTTPPVPESSREPHGENSVDCAGTICVAVGTSQLTGTDASTETALIDVFDGQSRGWRPVPTLAFPVDTQTSSAESVSCSSSGACVVVGTLTDTAGATHGWMAQGTGTTWSLTDLSTAGAPLSTFGRVSCRSDAQCVAVGRVDSTSEKGLVVLRRTGSSWSRVTATALPSFQPELACTTSRCVVSAVTADGTGHLYDVVGTTVAEAQQTKTSGAQPAPLTAVACSSTGTCATGGVNGVAGDSDQAVVGTETAAGSWAIGVAPVPAGAVETESVATVSPQSRLTVSCSDTLCGALKTYQSTSYLQRLEFVTTAA